MTLDPGDLNRVVRAALEEDLRYGPDVTTAAVIPPGTKSTADVVARQPGTLAGLPVVAAVLDVACPAAAFTPQARDGDRVTAGDVVARVEGLLAEILTAERTLLNFLTHMSGIAPRTSPARAARGRSCGCPGRTRRRRRWRRPTRGSRWRCRTGG